MDQTKAVKREPFDFGFAFLTNPPFVDEKEKKNYFCMGDYKPTEQSVQSKHIVNSFKIFKVRWVTVESEDVIYPYYAGICKQTFFNQVQSDYLVTGGVVYDGSGKPESQDYIIPRTTNYCFKIKFADVNLTLQYQIILTKEGKVTEDEQGNEIAEIIDVVPQMIYSRHNHMLFPITKQNPKEGELYYAIGGQEFTYSTDEDGKINYHYIVHNSCEMYDEKVNKWVEVASLKYPRAGFSGFVSQKKIYVFGGLSTNDFLGSTQSEVYDITLNQWQELKLRWKMGCPSQLLGASCVPLPGNDNKVLILGGSNGKDSTNSITALDLTTLQCTSIVDIAKTTVKLEVPRARKNVKIDHYNKSDDEYLIVFGGEQNSLSIESFEITDIGKGDGGQVRLKHVDYQKLDELFQQDKTKMYNHVGYSGIEAWAQASQQIPILLYSDPCIIK